MAYKKIYKSKKNNCLHKILKLYLNMVFLYYHNKQHMYMLYYQLYMEKDNSQHIILLLYYQIHTSVDHYYKHLYRSMYRDLHKNQQSTNEHNKE